MGNIYYLLDCVFDEKYIHFDFDYLKKYSKPCSVSAFQLIDKECVSCDILSGEIVSDFVYNMGIPIVSDRMKIFFEKNGIDNLFYKKIKVHNKMCGREYIYWIALPPRIDCLNESKSIFEEKDNSRIVKIESIKILDSEVGNYQIFKLKKVDNNEIFLIEDFSLKLQNQNFIGVNIIKID